MNWGEEQKQKIEGLSSGLSFTKYNLLKISSLERLIDVSHQNSAQCDQCKSNKEKLEKMVEQIPLLDQIDVRQPYEKEFNSMRSHLIKHHGFSPPSHFSSVWSLWLLLTGVSIGAIISLTITKRIVPDLVFIPSAIGLIIGYLIGSMRDRKNRNQKKLI
jgi:hypothetical protein